MQRRVQCSSGTATVESSLHTLSLEARSQQDPSGPCFLPHLPRTRISALGFFFERPSAVFAQASGRGVVAHPMFLRKSRRRFWSDAGPLSSHSASRMLSIGGPYVKQWGAACLSGRGPCAMRLCSGGLVDVCMPSSGESSRGFWSDVGPLRFRRQAREPQLTTGSSAGKSFSRYSRTRFGKTRVLNFSEKSLSLRLKINK